MASRTAETTVRRENKAKKMGAKRKKSYKNKTMVPCFS